ncbi:sedoheptulokinase [Elysia marginata]|uniref:Sedoheptulokinase n=1 Tax=Elysia marginata TaxID=1093978 RepID=A0AAV4EXE7_9GAST|nr:sedoheptulokinase [Elysia marginata]
MKFCAILADETTDVSCVSQFAVTLRYISAENKPVEKFLKFVDVCDRTASGLSAVLIDELNAIGGPDIKNKLIAQTYDGAAVMSGSSSGVQAIIKESFPHAHYVHCYAHQVNLILKKLTAHILPVRLFFANLSGFASYFSVSPKQSDKLRLPAQSDRHQTLSTGYGCATLFWLAQHRQALIKDQGFTACGTIMDYLVCRFCSLDHPVTSDHLAASFGYFNKETTAWDEILRQREDFPYQLLPHIIPAGKVVGYTNNVPGLANEIPVLVAMGDTQCAMRAVLSSPQDAVVNISTSIQLGFAVSKTKKAKIAEMSPPCISFCPYFDDQELALFAGLNGGNVFHCFAESVAQWVYDLGKILTTDDYCSVSCYSLPMEFTKTN